MSETKQIVHKRVLKLEPRHEQFISLMVNGLDHHCADMPDKPLGVPLSLDEAAQIVGIRMKHARRWMAEPVIKAAYNKAVAECRGLTQPMVLSQLKRIVASPVIDPKPSDIIKAGQILMGEDSKGFSVNVQVNNQTNNSTAIRAGYVLDLSALHGRRNRPNEPVTIEQGAARQGSEGHG